MKSLIPNSQTLFKEIVPLNLLHAPTSKPIWNASKQNRKSNDKMWQKRWPLPCE
jgi:hypothetical protein